MIKLPRIVARFFLIAGWLFSLAVTVFIVAFAVLNRESTPVTLTPFHDATALPVYVIVLGPLAAGLIAGAVFTWFYHLPLRLRVRGLKRQIEKFERTTAITAEPVVMLQNDHNLLRNKLTSSITDIIS
ncbi:MAG: LapA family protein [Alphaproteobacteria bacterium]|nr:LapA family protein [Alphaproteobacteria bacterium]